MKLFSKCAVALILCTTLLSSCYVNTFNVGKGAQGSAKTSKTNHYFIYGLAKGSTASPQEMAGGATDYTVTIQHSFVNGLLNVLTLGIYNPTTTEVVK